jgi:hypothetical protein
MLVFDVCQLYGGNKALGYATYAENAGKKAEIKPGILDETGS